MAKEVMSLTRDLFDEMLVAVAVKERHRIIELLVEAGFVDAVAFLEGRDG